MPTSFLISFEHFSLFEPCKDQFIRGRHVNGENISRKEIVLLIFGTRLFVGLFRI